MEPILSAQAAAATRDTVLWLALYVAVVTAPLFERLTAPEPSRGFGWVFSMTLRHAAIAMLGVQFALTVRRHEWRTIDFDREEMIS